MKKLTFKGSNSKPKSATTAPSSSQAHNNSGVGKLSDDITKKEIISTVPLTEAQKRHKLRQLEKEKQGAGKKLIETPYRERIEAFNNTLASMSEHNDIPRISAAGNG